MLDEHDDIQEALSRPVKEDSAEDKELEAELSELLDAGGDAATPPPPPPGSRNLDSGEDEELRARLDALSLNVSCESATFDVLLYFREEFVDICTWSLWTLRPISTPRVEAVNLTRKDVKVVFPDRNLSEMFDNSEIG